MAEYLAPVQFVMEEMGTQLLDYQFEKVCTALIDPANLQAPTPSQEKGWWYRSQYAEHCWDHDFYTRIVRRVRKLLA
jgi:hypothetical protein